VQIAGPLSAGRHIETDRRLVSRSQLLLVLSQCESVGSSGGDHGALSGAYVC
jgi:hypothetical protein